MAIIVGLALGLAGAEMQTILNNPLASPFTLGVSSAAAFGAALAIVLGIGLPGIPGQWFISANAFIFALLCGPAAGRHHPLDPGGHLRGHPVRHRAGLYL